MPTLISFSSSVNHNVVSTLKTTSVQYEQNLLKICRHILYRILLCISQFTIGFTRLVLSCPKVFAPKCRYRLTLPILRIVFLLAFSISSISIVRNFFFSGDIQNITVLPPATCSQIRLNPQKNINGIAQFT